jgi:hypothetical protein
LEEIEGWGTLVVLVGGEHDGAEVLLVPAGRVLPGQARPGPPQRRIGPTRLAPVHSQTSSVEADRRAMALLESLLDERQLAAWRTRRRFKVETPYGWVELGRLHEIAFQRNDDKRFVLCVVPRGPMDLPKPDIWANLLLILKHSPETFFRVANYSNPQRRRGA